MRLAQQLYEGVDIKGQGTVALISYLRTDSTRISEEADAMARSFIGEHYGENYVAVQESKQERRTRTIQDAHEAIRPTDVCPYAGHGKRISFQRPVPSLSADLETLCGKPDAACRI